MAIDCDLQILCDVSLSIHPSTHLNKDDNKYNWQKVRSLNIKMILIGNNKRTIKSARVLILKQFNEIASIHTISTII